MKLHNKTKLKVAKMDETKRNRRFENLCTKSQAELKKQLSFELRLFGKVRTGDGWVYKEGEIPILLVAHMDTVHKELVSHVIYTHGACCSPQGIGGDDRCGIYMIMEIIKECNCHVLFVEDEEIGCVGSEKFTKTELCESLTGKFQYLIELDRRGNNDAVFYYCDNKEFIDFVTEEYWEEQEGSYTDIVELSPVLGCASVNFSCGYYSEHKQEEFVILEEMENNIKEVKKLIKRTKPDMFFEYVEKRYKNSWEAYYDSWYGYEEEEWYVEYLMDADHENSETVSMVYATSYEAAVGAFCMEHPDITYNQILSIYNESYFTGGR